LPSSSSSAGAAAAAHYFVLSLLQKINIVATASILITGIFVIVTNLTSNYEHRYSYKIQAYKAVGYALEVWV